MSDFDLPRQILHASQEPRVDPFLHEQPRGGATRLPGVAEHAEDGGTGGRFDIRIVEDHVRGFASQLQADALHFHARLGADPLARPGLAGERDLVDLLAGDELRADDGPRARDQVEHTIRETGLLDELDQLIGGSRGIARRLDHDRAAGGQSRRDFASGLRQGKVPGRDHPHHAHRLLDEVDHGAAGQREAFAIELAREPGVKLEDVGGGSDVGHRLPHRHADFEAHDPGQTVGVVTHQTSRAEQHLLPQLPVVDPVADVAVERGTRGVDGRARVLLRPFLGERRDLANIRGILSGESSAARGLAFLTVDDQGAGQRQPTAAPAASAAGPFAPSHRARRTARTTPGSAACSPA